CFRGFSLRCAPSARTCASSTMATTRHGTQLRQVFIRPPLRIGFAVDIQGKTYATHAEREGSWAPLRLLASQRAEHADGVRRYRAAGGNAAVRAPPAPTTIRVGTESSCTRTDFSECPCSWSATCSCAATRRSSISRRSAADTVKPSSQGDADGLVLSG